MAKIQELVDVGHQLDKADSLVYSALTSVRRIRSEQPEGDFRNRLNRIAVDLNDIGDELEELVETLKNLNEKD